MSLPVTPLLFAAAGFSGSLAEVATGDNTLTTLLTLITSGALLAGVKWVYGEFRKMRHERDELVARVAQLEAHIAAAGVPVPKPFKLPGSFP